MPATSAARPAGGFTATARRDDTQGGFADLSAQPTGRLFACRSFQAVIDVHGPVPRQHLGLIGLMLALHHFDLFGAPFFRGFTKFGGDGIWVY